MATGAAGLVAAGAVPAVAGLGSAAVTEPTTESVPEVDAADARSPLRLVLRGALLAGAIVTDAGDGDVDAPEAASPRVDEVRTRDEERERRDSGADERATPDIDLGQLSENDLADPGTPVRAALRGALLAGGIVNGVDDDGTIVSSELTMPGR